MTVRNSAQQRACARDIGQSWEVVSPWLSGNSIPGDRTFSVLRLEQRAWGLEGMAKIAGGV